MPEALATRIEAIRARERALAKAVARRVFPGRPFTVWEVLLPFLAAFGLVRRSRLRELFAANFLFTKELALGGALRVCRGEETEAGAAERADRETREVLGRTPARLYSEEVRLAQLEEVALLREHYVGLLVREAGDHAEMVRAAYSHRAAWDGFLGRLAAVERGVSAAALRSLGAGADRELAERMAEATVRLRAEEADRIWGREGVA